MSFKSIMLDFKNGITSVFKGKPDQKNIYKSDGRVPFGQGLAFGIQHIFAMFIANVAPILIVFGFIGLLDPAIPKEYQAFATNAVQSCIFIAGVGTIVQLLLGARLPIVIGTSFTFVGLFMSFYSGKPNMWSSQASLDAYYTIMACIIIGGLFIAVVAPFVKWWRKLIKPIVPALVVTGIGLSLLSVGANYFLGESFTAFPNGNFVDGYWCFIVVALITLITSILWLMLARGIWKNLNIIVAMVVGYIFALIFKFSGLAPKILDFSNLTFNSVTDFINVPRPVDFSLLQFHPIPIVLTCVIFLVATVEGIGDSSAVCQGGLGRSITDRELGGVLTVDGLSSCLAGMFGSLPLTTFSQNVGIVSQTKMVNRFTIFIGACFLVLCGFFPPLAKILLTIPYCVLGGAILVVFGSIAVTGIQMVKELGFTEKNTFIMSLAICLGFGLTLVGDFGVALNNAGLGNVWTVISNPVLNMFVIAMILSWVLPESMHIGRKVKTEANKEETSIDDKNNSINE